MEASLAQRRYLFNLRISLGWPIKGIREMDSRQASLAIDEAKEELLRRNARGNVGENGEQDAE
jgi:hypothetical protein